MPHPDFADIGACVFDAYGTLFDVHSAVARGGETLGHKAEPISNLWRQKQLEYTWLRSLMGAHADFWQVTQEALGYAMAANKVDDPPLERHLMELYLTLEAYSDVRSCLEGLRHADLRTAVLSNGSPHMLDSAVKSAGLDELLDATLSVESVGIYKPDSRVYQMAADHLSVDTARICFVSTNAWDASGAAHFGFKVAWLNRFGKLPERLPGRLSAQMKGLDELSALVSR